MSQAQSMDCVRSDDRAGRTLTLTSWAEWKSRWYAVEMDGSTVWASEDASALSLAKAHGFYAGLYAGLSEATDHSEILRLCGAAIGVEPVAAVRALVADRDTLAAERDAAVANAREVSRMQADARGRAENDAECRAGRANRCGFVQTWREASEKQAATLGDVQQYIGAAKTILEGDEDWRLDLHDAATRVVAERDRYRSLVRRALHLPEDGDDAKSILLGMASMVREMRTAIARIERARVALADWSAEDVDFDEADPEASSEAAGASHERAEQALAKAIDDAVTLARRWPPGYTTSIPTDASVVRAIEASRSKHRASSWSLRDESRADGARLVQMGTGWSQDRANAAIDAYLAGGR